MLAESRPDRAAKATTTTPANVLVPLRAAYHQVASASRPLELIPRRPASDDDDDKPSAIIRRFGANEIHPLNHYATSLAWCHPCRGPLSGIIIMAVVALEQLWRKKSLPIIGRPARRPATKEAPLGPNSYARLNSHVRRPPIAHLQPPSRSAAATRGRIKQSVAGHLVLAWN